MKRFLLIIAFLALFLIGAKGGETDLNKQIVLVVVNKSDMNIAVQLTTNVVPRCKHNCSGLTSMTYYLSVPKANVAGDVTKKFDVYAANYSLQVHYLQWYDPVYGYECPTSVGTSLKLTHMYHIIVYPCNKTTAPSTVMYYLKIPLPTGGIKRGVNAAPRLHTVEWELPIVY